jgi:hypothetical protein
MAALSVKSSDPDRIVCMRLRRAILISSRILCDLYVVVIIISIFQVLLFLAVFHDNSVHMYYLAFVVKPLATAFFNGSSGLCAFITLFAPLWKQLSVLVTFAVAVLVDSKADSGEVYALFRRTSRDFSAQDILGYIESNSSKKRYIRALV